MTESASNVFRDFNTPGVPASGEYAPEKVLVRRWGREIEAAVGAAQANGGLVFDTKASLDADLAHGANSSAWVISDSTAANNGIYRKSGGSGSGSWSRVADLPYSFIALTDAGAGTANAIVATSDIPLASTPYKAILTLNVFEPNTADGVTLSVNGAAAKPLVSVDGSAVAEGTLTAGMGLQLVDDGTSFRILTDMASAGNLAASEAARDLARQWANAPEDETVEDPVNGDGNSSFHWANKSEAHADRSEAAAAVSSGAMSALVIAENTFATKATAEAWEPDAAPDYVRTAGYSTAGDGGGALYKQVGSEPSHDGKFSITLDDGVTTVWYELAEERDCRAYGAKCDGTTDDSAAVLRQYGHLGKIILPPDTTTVLSSWSSQSPTAPVTVTGERSVIKDLNASLFTLQDGSGIEVRGVTFEDNAAAVVALNSAANLDKFYWIDSGISGGLGIVPAGAACLDIEHVRVQNGRFYNLTADLLTLKSNIKKADICGNLVDGITTSGNSAQAFVLGKTQLSDQPNTGDYICTNNKVVNLEAQGTAAGEVHAFLLYGSRAVVSDNIIMDLSRTGSGANQEGIEGIYTKVRDVTITGNILVRAGREPGNKGGAINHKGVALNTGGGDSPLGGYFVIANNTIAGDSAVAHAGIRCEGDHGVITGNQIALCYYSINLAPSATAENVTISDNNCNQCTGPGGIRLNVVCDAVTVRGNRVEKAASPIFTSSGGDAIVLTTADRTGDVKHLNISDNQLLGAWEYGIRTQFGSPSICYDLHEQGNQIIGATYGLRNYPDAQISTGYVAGNLMRCTAAYRDKSTVLIYNGNYNSAAAV